MRLKDRTALVTGGSSGIGAEVVKKLAAMQFMVVMLARDSKKMDFFTLVLKLKKNYH